MDLSRLNEAQTQAVLHGDSPLLVLAGAGTGKTTAITYRIGHLIHERGVRPDQILALTFTNKAAREMRERAGQIARCDPRRLDMGTFHGMCGRLLRRHGEHIGLDSHFVIYDQDDQLQLIKRCAVEMNLDVQVFPPRMMRHRIEQWKNQGLKPDDVQPSQFDMVERKAQELYVVYRRRCLDANAVDFGDLLLHCVTLLKRNEEVRSACHERWTHILVDEYQDTNPVQYQLLRLLTTPKHSLTVVGDDDQSIYRWRGADIGNILKFEQDFVGAKMIRLELNYRSTQLILEAANAVIAHNVSRKGKTLYSHAERGDAIVLRVFPSERDEADAVASGIGRALDDGVEPGEVGVLYRTNAQSRPLEDALRRERIPYVIYGGVRFYDRKEIKNALGYMRLLINPRSDVDLLRVINVPARGIGKTSIERLQAYASANRISLFEAASQMAAGHGDVSSRLRNRLQDFVKIIKRTSSDVVEGHPGRVVEDLLSATGYLAALRAEGTEEATDRLENLAELVAAIDEYVQVVPDSDLAGFLEEVALASDIDQMDAGREQVSLMTLHAAKGLEFEVVFMPGLEEGIFPHSRSMDTRPALEEERRLCYVGLTRAKRLLFLSAARYRTVFGESRWSDLSRFVAELPQELLDLGAPVSQAAGVPRASEVDEWESYGDEPTYQLDADGVSSDEFPEGSVVDHATFGKGTVMSSEGAGKRRKLTIQFPGIGRKVIVARFVRSV